MPDSPYSYVCGKHELIHPGPFTDATTSLQKKKVSFVPVKNIVPPLQEKPKEGEGGEDDEEEALDEEDEFGEGDYEQVWPPLRWCPSGGCFFSQVLWNNTCGSFDCLFPKLVGASVRICSVASAASVWHVPSDLMHLL